MVGIPLPNLTLAAPSQSASGQTVSVPFNVGSGSAGGIPNIVWYAAILVAAYYVYKRVQ
jgi:hypothetical protein